MITNKVVMTCDRCGGEIPDMQRLYKVSVCGSKYKNIMKGHEDLCPKCAIELGRFLRGESLNKI